jgi:hypothetical protein
VSFLPCVEGVVPVRMAVWDWCYWCYACVFLRGDVYSDVVCWRGVDFVCDWFYYILYISLYMASNVRFWLSNSISFICLFCWCAQKIWNFSRLFTCLPYGVICIISSVFCMFP